MKRPGRIVLCIAGAVALLLAAALALLAMPRIQTAVARYASRRISEAMPGQIQLGSLKIKGFRTVELTDALLLDDSPRAITDTLLYARSIRTRIGLRSLLDGDIVRLYGTEMDGVVYNYVAYSRTENNFHDIFGPPTGKPFTASILTSDVLRLRDARFRMIVTYRDSYTYPGFGIDYTDMDVLFDADAERFSILDGEIRSRFRGVRLREACGLEAEMDFTFLYRDKEMSFDDVVYTDRWSRMEIPHFAMLWDNIADFHSFSDKVRLEAEFAPCTIGMHTFAYLTNLLPHTEAVLEFEGAAADGIWNNLDFKKFVCTDRRSGVGFDIAGRISGLGKSGTLRFDLGRTVLGFTPEGLSSLLADLGAGTIDTKEVLRGRRLSLDLSHLTGSLDSLRTEGCLHSSSVGDASLALSLTGCDGSAPVAIDGKVGLRQLDVGAIIKNGDIGRVSADIDASAVLSEDFHGVVRSLTVSRLEAMGRSFSGIGFGCDFSRDAISVEGGSSDPKLGFSLQASYSHSVKTGNSVFRLTMPVQADLGALGIDSREGGSKVSGSVNLSLRDLTQGRFIAGADILGVEFEDAEGPHDIGDIRLLSDYSSSRNHVTFNAPFATGGYMGDDNILHIADIIGIPTIYRDLPSLFASRRPRWDGRTFDLKFTFADTQDILGMLAPGLSIAPGTELRASVDAGGRFGATFVSDNISYAEESVRGISLSGSTAEGWTGLHAGIRSLRIGSARMDSLGVDAFARHDSLGVRTSDGRLDLGARIVRDGEHARIDGSLAAADISLADDLCGATTGLSGVIKGIFSAGSNSEGLPHVECNFSTSDFALKGVPAGVMSLVARDDGDEITARLRYRDGSGRTGIRADGSYDTTSGLLVADARLDRFNPGIAGILLSGVAKDLDGALSGSVSARGNLQHVTLRSKDLRLADGKVTVVPTGVTYGLEGTFSIDSERGLEIDGLTITDTDGGSATARGSLKTAEMSLNGLRVLDRRGTEGGLSGSLAASGSLTYDGADGYRIRGSLSTYGPGTVTVPLAGTSQTAEESTLTFRQPAPEEDELSSKQKEILPLDLACTVDISPEVSARIELDRTSGNMLNASGQGTIEVSYADGTLNLDGGYVLDGGHYNFSVLGGLITQNLAIEKGSSINFGGGLMDTEFDVSTVFTRKASLSDLISDTTSTVSSRRPVNCGLRISDKLSSPRIDFSVEVPDLDPATKTLVESELNTEDKVQKQFLALLLSGSFLPNEQGGVVNNGNIIYTNLSSMMSKQVNNILQKLSIPVDLGLNYVQNETGTDIFDVAISTTLFDDKVSVNGSVGNRRFSTGSNDDMIGDIDISIRLNESGGVLLTLFSHSADDYTNYLDNTQRSGVGIAFRKEYDSIGELFGLSGASPADDRFVTINIPGRQ